MLRDHVDDQPIDEVPFVASRQAGSAKLIGTGPRWPTCSTRSATSTPGSLQLNNFPRFMQEMSIPGNPLFDMGAVDILRARERGVPRYNEFRRQLGLKPIRTFDDLTDDKEHGGAAQGGLRRRRRGARPPGRHLGRRRTARPGFGFGETMFQIFILNASRRLQADRFYTDDYREEVYSKEGLAWVDDVELQERHPAPPSRAGEHRPRQREERLRAVGHLADAQRTAASAPRVRPRSEEGSVDRRRGSLAGDQLMFARPRFGLYRFLLGRVTAKGFKEQKVWPLELPASEHIEVEPLAPELPRLFGAKQLPADRARCEALEEDQAAGTAAADRVEAACCADRRDQRRLRRLPGRDLPASLPQDLADRARGAPGVRLGRPAGRARRVGPVRDVPAARFAPSTISRRRSARHGSGATTTSST